MVADTLAILYAILGGFFMGSYPVPIKAPAVVAAEVHPMIFQCYKSFWTFAFGWMIVLCNVTRGKNHAFEFTWWATVSAMLWVPSGFCTIAAVPLIGVGMTIVIATGLASSLSFLLFWLLGGEHMHAYGSPGNEYFLAPLYLVGILFGMCLLVASQHTFHVSEEAGARIPSTTLGRQSNDQMEEQSHGYTHDKSSFEEKGGLVNHRADSVSTSDIDILSRSGDKLSPVQTSPMLGIALSSLTGVFSAAQYGAVNVGKRFAERSSNCNSLHLSNATCSEVILEQFNPFGSWMASFGSGALAVTLIFLGSLVLYQRMRGIPLLELKFRLLCVPGSIAGLCWVVGALFQTAAAERGGNAVIMPLTYSAQLLTTGSWSLLYYREVQGRRRIIVWIIAALWTLGMMILLSGEKQ
eukprot:TRINITY_DN64418_c0_g1_i1.p1 TRINITY_DN64418_c0_g1~~TRINITY_DN64418_c0_g1_i1.p1  ORF type:complete len:409 (+),score=37.08 TRINITY_DN64418_c0_g1_i1:112-1338(+)